MISCLFSVISITCILLLTCNAILAQRSTPPVLLTKSNVGNIDNATISRSLHQISDGTEMFALELWKLMSDTHQKEKNVSNYMVSPFAVWSLLILLEEGAQNITKEELRQTLRLPDDRLALRVAYKQISQNLK